MTDIQHPTGDDLPSGYRGALSALAAAQKTSKGAPAYSRYVNRPLGRALASVAFVTGRTPNQVTLLSACFTYSAIVIIATVAPSLWVSLLICAGLVIGYALDAADGQLARLRGGGSVTGEWLDHTVDAVKISVLHLSVAISWFRFQDVGDSWLLVPLGFQAVSAVLFFSMVLMDQLRRAHQGLKRSFARGEGSSSIGYSLAVVLTDYGLLCWVLGLMFAHDYFQMVYLVLFVANAGFAILALPRWYREIGRFSDPSGQPPSQAPPTGPR